MTKKIFKSIFIPAIAVFLVSFAVTFYFFYNYYDEQTREELQLEAEYVEAGIETYGVSFLRELPYTEMRLTLVDLDGTVIFDSHLDDDSTLGMGNHLDREEISEAIENGEGYSSRYSDTLATTYVYYARVIEGDMVLRVSMGHLSPFAVFVRFLMPILLLTFAVAAVVFFIARKLSDSIVRPINEMDLENPHNTRVYDELRPIVNKISSQSYKIGKQMEEARLRQSEFASITSNMDEGMIIINSRAMILACNDSARRIFGVSETPHVVLALNDSPSFREAISSALAGKHSTDEMKTDEKHYSIIVTPVLSDGAVDGAVIMIIDDTEKEERESLRREFTSNVSHELKTPLTSISGYSELISSGMADGEDARRFAKKIKRESDRLVTLVGDIIRLTQLDGGEIPYDDGVLDLSRIAAQVADRLADVAAAEEVSLKVSAERAEVLGNEKILDEMIHNLIDNAIKYNRQGGSVKIHCKPTPEGALLVVSDTGIGIPADMQDRVFERFYRVDKSHSRKIGGTGLGLSIVKHAAAYHKAKITLKSVQYEGTEISVLFPNP
ncbi:MAG: histidine kinase [Clostridia bacterium]|nr:histidine kinase [Clostridia bacterium]